MGEQKSLGEAVLASNVAVLAMAIDELCRRVKALEAETEWLKTAKSDVQLGQLTREWLRMKHSSANFESLEAFLDMRGCALE